MADSLGPSERSLRASLAADSSWARTEDRSKRTAPARAAFLERFEREVDPDGSLDPEERARRAESAKRAYFKRLAYHREKAKRGQS